jgi:hypothetical protein
MDYVHSVGADRVIEQYEAGTDAPPKNAEEDQVRQYRYEFALQLKDDERVQEIIKKQGGISPLEVESGKDGKIGFKGGYGRKFDLGLHATTGTLNRSFGRSLITQAMETESVGEKTVEDHNRTLAALHAIQPQNGLEGMLAVQMVGMHNLSMTLMKMALLPNNLGSQDITRGLIEMANKCARTFTAQIEALNRLRGNGQQKVIVEHVTVNQGGQAVVGNVSHNGNKGAGGQG